MSRAGRVRRAGLAALGALSLPWLVLAGLALRHEEPLSPREGEAPAGEAAASVRVVDRTNKRLFESRDASGKRQRWLELAELGPTLPIAVIAAEDARFYAHPGLDPLAMARAVWQSVSSGDRLTGASTLTQQLARQELGAPRTLAGKVDVMSLALRLEMDLPKARILERYLNEIEFGPNLRGAEAASWHYFEKAARDLSLAEAATLASLPRGPTLYEPRRHPERAKTRRDRVLRRMAKHGFVGEDEARRAEAEPLGTVTRSPGGAAPHFVHALLAGQLSERGPQGTVEIVSSLDHDLQHELTLAARGTVDQLSDQHVSAAAVVVLDNRTSEILAYVGSPDAANASRLGGNDGVRAKRQPGSTLKPFVYQLAIERLGMSPATLLPDVELSFTTFGGDPFRPRNYDERFHGPVLLREALGNSYNVPAVWVAERLGPEAVLGQLHRLGFASLTKPAIEYGVGIALGDGEVTLLELAAAYATLARGGTYLPPRAVHAWRLGNGETMSSPLATERRVLERDSTLEIVDVLSDKRARAGSFGERTVFDLPFEVAAKTGTSKGFRDNWAVGFSSGVTVAVWVGNFDGSAMRGVSGISGAGPLFRTAMLAAERIVAAGPLPKRDGEDTIEVCALSGMRRGSDCPVGRHEHLRSLGASCSFHQRVTLDRLNGLLAGPACSDAVEERVVERFPPLYEAWAKSARRELGPSAYSPRCPGTEQPRAKAGVRILYPEDGARFFLEGDRVAHVYARAVFPTGAPSAQFQLGDALVAVDDLGRALLELSPGKHRLRASAHGATPDEIEFWVQ